MSQAIVRPEDTFDDIAEKVRIATIIGTVQSSLTHFPGLHKDFTTNGEEERLLGVSLSGILDNPKLVSEKWLTSLRDVVYTTNVEWAGKLGINASAAATCVKPDGNTSVLYNTSPGIHPRWSEYYIRRVRLQFNNPVAQWLMDAGVPVEPANGESWDNVRTVVFSFPVSSPKQSMYLTSATVGEQLETWLSLKKWWTEHNPSVTIHYKQSELDSIKEFCYKNQAYLSGVSFLENGHKYVQAPYEEIDYDTYTRLLSEFPKELEFDKFWEFETMFDSTSGTQNLACTGGSCLV